MFLCLHSVCARVCVSTFTKLVFNQCSSAPASENLPWNSSSLRPWLRPLTQRDKIPLNPSHRQKCSQAPPKICLYLALIHDCSSYMETALKCLPNQTGWTQLQWSVWRGRLNKVMTTGAFWERMQAGWTGKVSKHAGLSSRCLDGLPVNWKLLHFSPNCLREISTAALSETDMKAGRAASYSSVSVLFFISH